MLYLLRDRGRLEQGELEELIHRFRRAGARYLSLDGPEVALWVQRAQIVDGKINESHELRTLRRNMAYSIVDCDVLTIASDELGAPLERPFLLKSEPPYSTRSSSSGRLPIRTISNWRAPIGSSTICTFQTAVVALRMRSSGPTDLQLEAAVLAGFLVGSFAVPAWRQDNRQSRRQFLNWIYSGLIHDRFDADPALARTTVEIAKRLLVQSAAGMPGKDGRIAGALATLLKTWLEDLPDPIRDVFGRDSAFCALGSA